MKKNLSIFVFCLLTFQVFGQVNTPEKKGFFLWGNTGFCLTSAGNSSNLMFGGRVSLNFTNNQKHFISALYQESFYVGSRPFSNQEPNKLLNLKNGSLLFGLGKYKHKSLALIGSAGISYGKALYRGDILYYNPGGLFPAQPVFEEANFYYLGLPLNFKILWTSPVIGLSIDLYANLHKHSDYGIILSINIGKIRDKKNSFR